MKQDIVTQGGTRVVLDLEGFDRIRQMTSDDVNAKIAEEAGLHIRSYVSAGPERLSRRIEELEREWDIDRGVMAAVASLGALTTTLGVTRSRRWFGFLGVQLSFLMFHAAKGWCPTSYVLRRLGFRSRAEIDAEKYALKTLRGDFRNERAA